MLLNMAQSTPWELIFHTKCWKRQPNETTLLASNTNVWRSKTLITHPRVMTLSSALLPFIIWNHFRIFARRYTDASLPGEPLFSLSSIPCLQLTVVKTGSMTNKETYSTGRWTAISRKENGEAVILGRKRDQIPQNTNYLCKWTYPKRF